MPTLSEFYGIKVLMYREISEKHKLPHIHVSYSGEEAVYTLGGDVLEGKLPQNAEKLLLAWMLIHSEELQKNWDSLSAGENIVKIAPLL